MIPLTNKECKSYVHYHNHDKNYPKIRSHCHLDKYRGAALTIFNIKYNTPKEICVVLHSRFKYDYHFIKKELTK